MKILNVKELKPTLTAVQWTGDNFGDIKFFVGTYREIAHLDKSNSILAYLNDANNMFSLSKWDFLVKYGKYNFKVFNKKEFFKKFDIISEEYIGEKNA